MAAPLNDPDFTLGEDYERPTVATIRRPSMVTPVTDDLRSTMVANLMDGLHAAWNGWEQACKFEDEGMQTYYMKYVITLQGCLEKIKKI